MEASITKTFAASAVNPEAAVWTPPLGMRWRIMQALVVSSVSGNLVFKSATPQRELHGSVECANAGPYVLVDGQTLTVKIDGQLVAQTITFHTADFVDISAATAAEVAAAITARITGATAAVTNTTKVTITSSSTGASSSVEVTGGTSNAALGFDTNPHAAPAFGSGGATVLVVPCIAGVPVPVKLLAPGLAASRVNNVLTCTGPSAATLSGFIQGVEEP